MSMTSSVRVGWALCVLALAPLGEASAEEISHYNGQQLYARFCAACHGEKGEGDGDVAPFFKLTPPDLTRLAKRRGGQFPVEEVRSIIDGRTYKGPHGTRNMPIWGMEFSYADTGPPDKQKQVDSLIDRLVQYLRSIQKN
jgi:mono/diheme cytochrome c family protein